MPLAAARGGCGCVSLDARRRRCSSVTSPSARTRTRTPGSSAPPGGRSPDLGIGNEVYNPRVGAELYNRYLDERVYAEEMGFDGVMLNEHHSTPFCMGSVMNVEAAILARITKRVKIVLLGNVLPIWDDPLFLAEELAEIDMISRGRLVTGWVRGTGRESVSHNSQPPFNWERFQEAHDFVVKAWTTPGPYRWEGEHYNFRYVNPWAKPYQQPHPPIWIPGVMSRNTVEWSARHRYPYVMLATDLEPTKQSFEYYAEVAKEEGYEAGTQHRGYLFKVHVDETEELAYETARKYIEGPPNPFLEGNQGVIRPFLQNLPGMTSRTNLLPTSLNRAARISRGREQRGADPKSSETTRQDFQGTYDDQLKRYTIITGTPKTVIPQGPPRPRVPAPGHDLLLGRRRRHDPRGPDAQPQALRRGGHPRRPRDRRGAGAPRLVRGRPGDQPAGPRRGRQLTGRLAPAEPRSR